MIETDKIEIPIVFSTDENYVVPTIVAGYSVLKNLKSNTFVRFYIMVPDSVTEREKTFLRILEWDDISAVEFINMDKSFSDIKMSISYISFATYFRLALPNILQNINKCIYLDSDLVVNSDISELYAYDIQDEYIAGCVAAEPTFSDFSDEEKIDHAKLLGVDDLNGYINAGVLLMNLKKIRDDNMTKVLLGMVNNDYPYQDQDIINSAFYKHICFLPRKYNVGPLKRILKEEKKLPAERIKKIDEAYARPAIIHYAQPQKPWICKNLPMTEYWWDSLNEILAKDSLDPELKRIIDDFLRSSQKKAYKLNLKHNKLVMIIWKKVKKYVRKK